MAMLRERLEAVQTEFSEARQRAREAQEIAEALRRDLEAAQIAHAEAAADAAELRRQTDARKARGR